MLPSKKALILAVSASVLTFSQAPLAAAQGQSFTAAGTSRPLQLAADSPYRDPDIIYLEADEVINSEQDNVLTAQGQVEGRYQDRTLRADKVIYNLDTGMVIASGNVILVDATGSSQYADKIELTGELETGTAADFTSRFANGGVLGAAFATRESDQGIQLYNAYYTACKPCKGKKPTWQIKARKVSQKKDQNMILYRDAVLQFLGVPFLYTPYLAHPDPTVDRASGWLEPFVGVSNSKGFNVRTPYYWAIDPYSELTLTPRVFQKVNPVMGYKYRRKFHTGEVNVEGSFTYGSFFKRDGEAFSDTDTFNRPDKAPLGERLRSHFLANGIFEVSEDWDWGFGIQGATDDLYLNRYDFDQRPPKFGLYNGDGQRLVSQFFSVRQDDDSRFSVSAYGFQSLRTTIREDDRANPQFDFLINTEDDSTLPIIAPKIELSKFIADPILNGRLKASGDFTMLTRKAGTDYTRATAELEWEKTAILPGGIEAKPFGSGRVDYFKFKPEDAPESDFNRTLGQVGVDVRWPFINAGKNVSFIVEPRALVTQSFGDGKDANFSATDSNNQTISLYQDSTDIDLDTTLFWSPNKSTGYDFWQEGFRADVGGSVAALWDDSKASLFLGRSFASDYTNTFGDSSGLAGDKSDYVGQVRLELGNRFSLSTLARYDDTADVFRRINSEIRYKDKRLNAYARYYRLNSSGLNAQNPLNTQNGLNAPDEEISGSVTLNLIDGWSARYKASHDLDADITRRQEIALIFKDDCTLVEFVYHENNFDDIIRNSSGFGIRVSLLTLGDFSPE